MDPLDEEAHIHSHVIFFLVASFLHLKCVSPNTARLFLEDSWFLNIAWLCFTLEPKETAIIWKWIVSALFLILSGTIETQWKTICPVLTPRFSSIALDDHNVHSMVFYCFLGSPGERLCAWHKNILGLFKVFICKLFTLTHTTA